MQEATKNRLTADKPPENAHLSKPYFPVGNSRQIHPRIFNVERKCEQCGKTFKAKTSTTRFCSAKCMHRRYYLSHKGKAAKNPRHGAKETITGTIQSDPDLLTVKQFAKKLGVCKQTVYSMSARGQVHIIRFTQRLSYIRWSEFTASLDRPHLLTSQPTIPGCRTQDLSGESKPQSAPALSVVPAESNLNPEQWIDKKGACKRYDKARNYNIPTGYITVSSAQEKYGLPASTIYYKLRHHHTDMLKVGKRIFFPESELIKLLAAQAGNVQPSISSTQSEAVSTVGLESTTEWLDAAAASQRYNLSIDSFYAYANKMKILKKVVDDKVLYSISELNSKRGFNITIPPDYISVEDARSKYKLTVGNIYSKLHKHHIQRIKKNRKVYFSEAAFAETLRPCAVA